MKSTLIALFAVALMVGFSSFTVAESEGKEVSLTGTLACGKCELGEAKKCHNVLVVKDGDTSTTYWLTQNEVSKSKHKHVCQSTVDGVTVKGTHTMEDGKHVITAKEIVIPDKG